jgi:cytochrome c553
MRWLPLLLLLGIAAAQAAQTNPAKAPAGRFKDAECIACHGPDSPEVQGWRLSKHGVLVRISTPGRAPGCVDCHGAEAPGRSHRRAAPRTTSAASFRAGGTSNPEAMREVCGKCHSPRYLDTLAANGQRMVAVGEMKQREALALLTQARRRFPADRLKAMEEHYRHLQIHLRNIRMGVGHQSPDHQWWHGHPALDGDLLRIKGAWDDLMRAAIKP